MKKEILEKIEILFWENAFAEVSMDDIAKKLDMKKASLYYHFSSKEQMFIEVLEFSFAKYNDYLSNLFQKSKIEDIIMGLISFPLTYRNLFSIVSQKGYCKIGNIRDLIVQKNMELFMTLSNFLNVGYSFSNEKTILFQSVINSLSNKYCIFDCKETLDLNKLVPEIKNTFFN